MQWGKVVQRQQSHRLKCLQVGLGLDQWYFMLNRATTTTRPYQVGFPYPLWMLPLNFQNIYDSGVYNFMRKNCSML